jgi:hypothetical protein
LQEPAHAKPFVPHPSSPFQLTGTHPLSRQRCTVSVELCVDLTRPLRSRSRGRRCGHAPSKSSAGSWTLNGEPRRRGRIGGRAHERTHLRAGSAYRFVLVTVSAVEPLGLS